MYLKYAVLLLAGVFEKFRNRCLENDDLCSIHYLRAPFISWDTILSMTKVDIDLISHNGMYLCFEKDITKQSINI